jgi:hypothetical protein
MSIRQTILRSLIAVLFFSAAGVSYSQTAGAAILARDEPVEGAGRAASAGAQGFGGAGGGTSTGSQGKARSKTSAKRTTTARTVTPARPKPWNGFIVGDKYTFLNFEVVSAEKPYHTRDAKANGAKGLVQVEVLIDTNGNVIQAKGRTGNKLLHPEAERAALASKFNRPTFGGKPARAIGFLVYRFGPAEDED